MLAAYQPFSTFPLLLESASVLMQRTPVEIERQLPIAYQRVSFLVMNNTPIANCIIAEKVASMLLLAVVMI